MRTLFLTLAVTLAGGGFAAAGDGAAPQFEQKPEMPDIGWTWCSGTR